MINAVCVKNVNLFALLIDRHPTNCSACIIIILSTPQTAAFSRQHNNAVELVVNGKQAALQAAFCVEC